MHYLPLGQNNLRGNIPQELAGLNLTTIDFLENNLNGTVPQEIYTLKDLNYLNLGYNDLTGTVASELGDLNKLSECFCVGGDLISGVVIDGHFGDYNDICTSLLLDHI